MTPSSRDSQLVLDLPLEQKRRELAPRLFAIVAARGSRKAAWELLREAGITTVSLKSFYTLVRERGLDGAVDAVITPAALPAIEALLANPPAPPPVRVAVSTLANQFYCEMQVHLGTHHDVRVVSREMLAGTAGHAAFEAEAEPVTEEEVAKKIEAGEAFGLVELALAGEVDGVKLVGRADRVQLEGNAARLVLEFKFAGRRELYASHVAQVEAYGVLLGARGFDTRELVHAVALVPRGGARPEGLADQMAQRALEVARAEPWPAGPRSLASVGGTPDVMGTLGARRVETDAFTLWVFPHDAAQAERDLGWALAYWKGARAPVPTTIAGKCRACPYNAAALCDAARAAPDGRFVAQAVETKRGTLHLVAPAPR